MSSRRAHAGYRGYKMKIGNIAQTVHANVLWPADLRLSFDDDIARIAAAREALGPELNLMIDANTSLSSRMAMRYAEARAAVQHQMVRRADPARGHRRLCRARTPHPHSDCRL